MGASFATEFEPLFPLNFVIPNLGIFLLEGCHITPTPVWVKQYTNIS